MSHDVNCRECGDQVPVTAGLHWKSYEGLEASCPTCGLGKCTWVPVDHGAVVEFNPYTDHELALRALTAPQDPTELDEHQTIPCAPSFDDEWDVPTEPTLPSFEVRLYGAAVNDELGKLGEDPVTADELRALLEVSHG